MNDIYKKWWFWVAAVAIIGIIASRGGGSGNSSDSSSEISSDSLDLKSIKATHLLLTNDDFKFIEAEGIYGLSSMWSTDNEIANKLAKAQSDNTPSAFMGGNLGTNILRYEYRYKYQSENGYGCIKDHWVEINLDLTEKAEKTLGWEFGKGSNKDLLITGKIIKKKVNPAQSACDNGFVSIDFALDKIYDVKTKKVLIQ